MISRSGNRVHIKGHLILPFGTKRNGTRQIKDLSHVSLKAVAANGIYFEFGEPTLYIDVAEKTAIRLKDWKDVFVDQELHGDYSDSPEDIVKCLNVLEAAILRYCGQPTKHEVKFLELYFEYLRNYVEFKAKYAPSELIVVFNALLPVPEVQVYVQDPLDERLDFIPNNNFRVDYAFWTGNQLLAIEIDGSEPEGYARDIRRDRLLRRAGIDVIHVLNSEITKHGIAVIEQLLPRAILHEWKKEKAATYNPFFDFPF